MMQWRYSMAVYILRDNQQEGPYEEAQLRAALATGSVEADTLAWIEGTADWQPISALFPSPEPEPAPAAPGPVREIKAPKMGFGAILLDSIRYPFCRSGWITIVVGAAFFTIARLFTGFIGGLFISGYLLAFYMDIIGTSALGEDKCPDWPGFSSFIDDILNPYFRGMSALFISILPALVLGVMGAANSSKPLLAAAGAAVVWSAFYYPLAIIGTVIFGNIGGTLPHRVIPAMVRTFPSSLLPGITNVFIIGILIVNTAVSTHIPFFGKFYDYSTYLFFMTMQGRFLGLFYRRERDKLGWE
jgi:hypothetical protein